MLSALRIIWYRTVRYDMRGSGFVQGLSGDGLSVHTSGVMQRISCLYDEPMIFVPPRASHTGCRQDDQYGSFYVVTINSYQLNQTH